MREGERARCAYGQGQRLAGGLGNPIGEVKTVRLMSHERLQTGPAGLAAGLRYTTVFPAQQKTYTLRITPQTVFCKNGRREKSWEYLHESIGALIMASATFGHSE